MMSMKHKALGLLLTATIACGGTAFAAPPQERGDIMTQHVREEVRNRKPLGNLAADKVLHFDMLLPPAAPEQLDQFLSDVYNPASASYRHFLTPAQFTARFGPSTADWNELVRFAEHSGFSITGGSRDEMDLRLAAPVRAIEAAFHVTMRVYNHPTESRTFYSPDTEPTIDMQAAVWHVSGLDNFSTPHARVQSRAGASAAPLTSTGGCPGNAYCGSDMRAAYYGGGTLTGAGQSIGLVEFYGYDTADLNTYFNNAGQINKVPVHGISTDGTPLTCVYSSGCDDTEQTLDITQALGMAPGLSQLNVYVGGSDTAILSAMSVPPVGSVTGKVDAQLSCSWGWGPADPAADDPLFKKFAAQGQTFFTAAGDSGAYTPASQYVFPADDANVTVVGGTDLSTAGAGGTWLYESVWADGGGGYLAADNVAIPSWQTAAVAAFNRQSGKQGSTALRNSPDVAAEANFDFYVCADQQGCTSNRYGGTSFAAPMWAGYMALVNQQAAINGRSPVGFLNPSLYALGDAGGSGYSQAFHDIAAGSNGYPAVTGYDLATGWGSPNGAGLIAALAGAATPGFSLTSSGTLPLAEGGTATSTLSAVATGGFNSGITLSATGQPSGVTVGFSPSSITGAGSSTVTFHSASTVPAGTYLVTLTGTGTAGTGGTKITGAAMVSLTVTQPNFSLAAGGPITVIASKTGSLTVSSTATGGFNSAIALTASGLPVGVTAQFSPSSITASGASTLSFITAAATPAGSYSVTVTGTGGGVAHGTNVTLTVVVPGFSLNASAAAVSLAQGLSGSVAVSSTTVGGFAGAIALTVSGQPSGVTVGLAPASITGGGSSTVTVAVGSGVASGTYPLVLSGTSGASTQHLALTLSVSPASFSISAAAPSLSVLQGAGGGVSLTTAGIGVLNAPITLSASGQPAGVTATFSSGSVVSPGSVTLAVTAAANAVPGSYSITVSGASGSATSRVTVPLVIGGATPSSFVVTVGTTALAVTHGTSATFTVKTALTGAAAPSIALSASGLPAGVTVSFSPSTLGGAGVSTVTLTAAASAKSGTATVTFSGAAGGTTQSSTVNLTVN